LTAGAARGGAPPGEKKGADTSAAVCPRVSFLAFTTSLLRRAGRWALALAPGRAFARARRQWVGVVELLPASGRGRHSAGGGSDGGRYALRHWQGLLAPGWPKPRGQTPLSARRTRALRGRVRRARARGRAPLLGGLHRQGSGARRVVRRAALRPPLRPLIRAA